MTTEEINQFLTVNDADYLNKYFEKIYDKIKEINGRMGKLTIYLLLILIIFYLISRSHVSDFTLGPIKISDLTIIAKCLPVCLFYINLEYLSLSKQKALAQELICKWHLKKSSYLGNANITGFDIFRNEFLKNYLPLSFQHEFTAMSDNKGTRGNINAILMMPFLLIAFLPGLLSIEMLVEVLIRYPIDFLSAMVTIISIYIFISTVFYSSSDSKNLKKRTMEMHQIGMKDKF